MTRIEAECEHGARVRITDCRDPALAQIDFYTCSRPCCMHAAFHTVQDTTGRKPVVVPLPPV